MEYLAPIPQATLDKAAQFLTLMGGKNAIQYHWIIQNGPTNTTLMDESRAQAPLCIALYCNDFSWNFVEPQPVSGQPCHAVLDYASEPAGEMVLDHYIPFDKILVPAYPIPYVMQGVVQYIAPVEQEIVNTTAQVVQTIAKDTTDTPAEKIGWAQTTRYYHPVNFLKAETYIDKSMSPATIGFLRGAGYATLGGAFFGLSNFLLAQPFLAGGIALLITGAIAAIEDKYNIPVPSAQ